MFTSFHPGAIWPDDHGVHINAHGGGILVEDGVYYWYGEHKIEGRAGNYAHVGVHVYTSTDLMNWTDAGIALDIRGGRFPELQDGCIIERPKVARSLATGAYVMLFHYEADSSYNSAAVGFAVAESPLGPFTLHHIQRPDIGVWPLNTPPELKDPDLIRRAADALAASPNGRVAGDDAQGLLGATLSRGQDSRDMTLFRDDDGKTYQIYSSEQNAVTHLTLLTDDLLGYAGTCVRLFPGRYMEAHALFKRQGKYYFIGSGCTGWKPNAARSAVADSLLGPWTELDNPARGENRELTFNGQSNYILRLDDDRIVFMADIWRPDNAIDGRYLWLPIRFDGIQPYFEFTPEWSF